MAPEEVAETYRLRWQIELAFKRLKSGLGIDVLPARDRELARSWLAAHLILGLIIDEAVSDTFACSPSMQPPAQSAFEKDSQGGFGVIHRASDQRREPPADAEEEAASEAAL